MKKGFSLVELLVVIAIIAVLAGFVMINFVDARMRARDAQRKADLAKIAAALEQYKADVGWYPQAPDTASTSFPCSGIPSSSRINAPSDKCRERTVRPVYMRPVLSKYLSEIPSDPSRPVGATVCSDAQVDYAYRYDASRRKYILFAKLENPNDPDAKKQKVNPYVIGLDTKVTAYCDVTDTSDHTGPTCSNFNLQSDSDTAPCANIFYNYWIVSPTN